MWRTCASGRGLPSASRLSARGGLEGVALEHLDRCQPNGVCTGSLNSPSSRVKASSSAVDGALRQEAEVAARPRGAGVVGELGRELRELLARRDALADFQRRGSPLVSVAESA